jgi:hypothetical protein
MLSRRRLRRHHDSSPCSSALALGTSPHAAYALLHSIMRSPNPVAVDSKAAASGQSSSHLQTLQEHSSCLWPAALPWLVQREHTLEQCCETRDKSTRPLRGTSSQLHWSQSFS